jgi:hypothetical protein
MAVRCVGYIVTVPSECITEWSNELSGLSPEKKAEWRGSRFHVTNTVMPVRWNAELEVFELKLNETVKTYIKTEKVKNCFIMFPEKKWAPIAERGKSLPSNIMDYYYPMPTGFEHGETMPLSSVQKTVEGEPKLQTKQSASSWGTWSKLEFVKHEDAPSHDDPKHIGNPEGIQMLQNAAQDSGLGFADFLWQFERKS